MGRTTSFPHKYPAPHPPMAPEAVLLDGQRLLGRQAVDPQRVADDPAALDQEDAAGRLTTAGGVRRGEERGGGPDAQAGELAAGAVEEPLRLAVMADRHQAGDQRGPGPQGLRAGDADLDGAAV